MGAPTWLPNPQRSERPGKPVPLLDPPPTLGAPRPSRGISRYSDRLLEIDGQESAAQSARAERGCPGAGGVLGERDDRRAPRPGGKGSQHPARLGIGEHEGDDGFRVLVQTACQLPRPADLDTPAGEIVQRGLDPGGVHGVARHDDHGPGLRVAHVTLAAVEATKRRTSLIGIASARPPAIIVLIPTTRPAVSARGPPEFPGARRTSAWIQRRPPGRAGASAWTTPAVSVRRRPSGWPRATTRAPTRNASESASSAGATPERGMRRSARSARRSAMTRRASTCRSSASPTRAHESRATWAFVTTRSEER